MLADLPFELLAQIVSSLPTAQSVYHLALTCKRLDTFVSEEGWRIFTRSSFPSIPTEPHWQDAAHSLTTLSRNWDRRAFLAKYIEPSTDILCWPEGKHKKQWHERQDARASNGSWARRLLRQTMGYQPYIDSYEEWTGGSWSSRREVLAWSAGPEVVVRVTDMGDEIAQEWEAASNRNRDLHFDHHRHKTRWITYKPSGAMEGIDDFSVVKLLKTSHKDEKGFAVNVDSETLLLGSASGGLSLVQLPLNQDGQINVQPFMTSGQQIRTADISPSEEPLIAAVLSDRSIAVYSTALSEPQPSQPIEPLSSITPFEPGDKPARIWSTTFLSESLIAVGLGPSKEPIHIMRARPSGIHADPIRKVPFKEKENLYNSNVFEDQPLAKNNHSVYSIIPLPPSSQASNAPGEVFLSGSYDGMIRVHDLRSPRSTVGLVNDHTDDSPIYSLATLGRERLAAGTAHHSVIRFFDIRVTGGRAYHYADVKHPHTSQKPWSPPSVDANPSSQTLPTPVTPAREKSQALESGAEWATPSRKSLSGSKILSGPGFNCNVFLNPVNPIGGRRRRYSMHRMTESPIYSLSIPSAHSPRLYAGVEGAVMQLDFVSILDRCPDPIYEKGIQRIKSRSGGVGEINVKMTWAPKDDVLNLGMYEHSGGAEGGDGMFQLRTQTGVGKIKGQLRGWDERWRDPREA